LFLNEGEDIDEGGDPPRLWSRYGEYPGTAFTRSLGDSIAEELGVYAGEEEEEEAMTLGYDTLLVAFNSNDPIQL